MKTVLVAIVLLHLTCVRSEWIIARFCPGAPYHEVRARNGNCAQFDQNNWRQVNCDSQTANSFICSDSKCQNCTLEYSAPLNTCSKLANITCQKDQPQLQDLMGQNYLVFARRYSCNSEIISLDAANPDCAVGPETSFAAKCSGDQATFMTYSSPDCNGKPTTTSPIILNHCDSGLETFCNQN